MATTFYCHLVLEHTYLKQAIAVDHEGLWLSRGAGQYTDATLQTVRDPTSLSAQH